MVHCVLCGISTEARNYGITFHKFPRNETLRQEWINFVKERKIFDNVLKSSSLCSQHFESSCFDRSSSLKIRLKPDSIPTIHISRLRYVKYFENKAPNILKSGKGLFDKSYIKKNENHLLRRGTFFSDTDKISTVAQEASTSSAISNQINILTIEEQQNINKNYLIDLEERIADIESGEIHPYTEESDAEPIPSTSKGTYDYDLQF